MALFHPAFEHIIPPIMSSISAVAINISKMFFFTVWSRNRSFMLDDVQPLKDFLNFLVHDPELLPF